MNILTEKELQFLKELKSQKIPFIIVGMMAAVLQDVPMVTQDVDLWFENIDDPRLVQAAKKVGAVFLPANIIFQIPPLLKGESIENFDIVYGIQGLQSFAEE